MSLRPTPETDDAQWGTGKVTTDFARRLERERDEARRELNEIRAERDLARLSSMESDQVHDRMVGELEKVYKERDEARAAARTLAEHGEREMQKLIKERDEAREALAEAWRFADQWLALADGYLKRINEIQNDIRKN